MIALNLKWPLNTWFSKWNRKWIAGEVLYYGLFCERKTSICFKSKRPLFISPCVITVNNWCCIGKSITWKWCQGYEIFVDLSQLEKGMSKVWKELWKLLILSPKRMQNCINSLEPCSRYEYFNEPKINSFQAASRWPNAAYVMLRVSDDLQIYLRIMQKLKIWLH